MGKWIVYVRDVGTGQETATDQEAPDKTTASLQAIKDGLNVTRVVPVEERQWWVYVKGADDGETLVSVTATDEAAARRSIEDQGMVVNDVLPCDEFNVSAGLWLLAMVAVMAGVVGTIYALAEITKYRIWPNEYVILFCSVAGVVLTLGIITVTYLVLIHEAVKNK